MSNAEGGKFTTTLRGTVQKVIKSAVPNKPDIAQIVIEGAQDPYREICMENTLTMANGEEVRLKPGARIEITVITEGDASTSEISK